MSFYKPIQTGCLTNKHSQFRRKWNFRNAGRQTLKNLEEPEIIDWGKTGTLEKKVVPQRETY